MKNTLLSLLFICLSFGNFALAQKEIVKNDSEMQGEYSGIRINAGGEEYTDSDGNVWKADTYYTDGDTFLTSSPVSGTIGSELYQSERWGADFSYDIPVADGDYQVVIHLAEIFFEDSGNREFTIMAQGQLEIEGLDVFDLVGNFAGYEVVIDVEASDGEINLNFLGVSDNAKVSAIEIISLNDMNMVTTTTTTMPDVDGTTTTTTTTLPDSSSSSSSSDDGTGSSSSSSSSGDMVDEILTSILRLNAGGPDYVDTAGNLWVADQFEMGGFLYSVENEILLTDNDPLYQTERYGDFTYSLPVDPGVYQVDLHLAEIFHDGLEDRLFTVMAEGETLISSFDIVAAAGDVNTAHVVSFRVMTEDSSIDLDFSSNFNFAKLSGLQVFSVMEDDSGSSSSSSSSGGNGMGELRVNSGGPEYVDMAGNIWSADNYFTGGMIYMDDQEIDGTLDDAIYQTERYGNPFSYDFPVENGDYQVVVHLAEIFFDDIEERVFSISAEGEAVLVDYDLFASGGYFSASQLVVDVTVVDGELNLDFDSIVNFAKISGVEVLAIEDGTSSSSSSSSSDDGSSSSSTSSSDDGSSSSSTSSSGNDDDDTLLENLERLFDLFLQWLQDLGIDLADLGIVDTTTTTTTTTLPSTTTTTMASTTTTMPPVTTTSITTTTTTIPESTTTTSTLPPTTTTSTTTTLPPTTTTTTTTTTLSTTTTTTTTLPPTTTTTTTTTTLPPTTTTSTSTTTTTMPSGSIDPVNVSCETSQEDFMAAMLTVLNESRNSQQFCGDELAPVVSSLVWNDSLELAAQNHSQDMVVRNFVAHVNPDEQGVGDRVSETGFTWSFVGENIAGGYSNVQSVHNAWMASPGHCRNIMRSSFTMVGASCVNGGPSNDYSDYWTVVFAAPAVLS